MREQNNCFAVVRGEATCRFRHEPNMTSPEARSTLRRNAVAEIVAKTTDAKEQKRLYTEQTGSFRADFYRRKREVEAGDFDEHDAA